MNGRGLPILFSVVLPLNFSHSGEETPTEVFSRVEDVGKGRGDPAGTHS